MITYNVSNTKDGALTTKYKFVEKDPAINVATAFKQNVYMVETNFAYTTPGRVKVLECVFDYTEITCYQDYEDVITLERLYKAVDRLNEMAYWCDEDSIHESDLDIMSPDFTFSLRLDGDSVYSIWFLGSCLWDSETDDRNEVGTGFDENHILRESLEAHLLTDALKLIRQAAALAKVFHSNVDTFKEQYRFDDSYPE